MCEEREADSPEIHMEFRTKAVYHLSVSPLALLDILTGSGDRRRR